MKNDIKYIIIGLVCCVIIFVSWPKPSICENHIPKTITEYQEKFLIESVRK